MNIEEILSQAIERKQVYLMEHPSNRYVAADMQLLASARQCIAQLRREDREKARNVAQLTQALRATQDELAAELRYSSILFKLYDRLKYEHGK